MTEGVIEEAMVIALKHVLVQDGSSENMAILLS
jgi:hypothetical protein